MLNFETWLNLPLIWGILLSTAILIYIVLDGFDLGVGILFPFANNSRDRNKMMNSIAPFWDGNETWLVLGGGGLFAVFPLAYSVLMPAFYIPIILMLLCLVLRGVAFEFRYKSSKESRYIWDACFHFGSLGAAFAQGVLLGGIFQGVEVTGRSFSGGAFDWLTAFSIFSGIAVVFVYALLGATWMIMKTEGKSQKWARKVALYLSPFAILLMSIVSIWLVSTNDYVYSQWLGENSPLILLLIPVMMVACLVLAIKSTLSEGNDWAPFLWVIASVLFSFVGLVISVFPWLVPYAFTLEQVAAVPESQSILLIGTVFLLPIILSYTFYNYYVFRGKVHEKETMY